jgi:hypothetical protein
VLSVVLTLPHGVSIAQIYTNPVPGIPGVLIVPPLSDPQGRPLTIEGIFAAQRETLMALSEDEAQLWIDAQYRVDAVARALGMDRAYEEAEGRLSLMSDVAGGVPQYYTTLNAASADTISADELYAGGSLGLSLSGAGVTLGMWDGGDVLSNHVEFSTGGQRVADRDGASVLGVQLHPTHVAGTLAAGGVSTNARGMSPAAILDAYDFVNDLSEIAGAAGADLLRVSNHSYGYKRGWDTLSVTGVLYDAWFGDTSVDDQEDYRYGFYDQATREGDRIVYNAPWYLPAWSAGNERGSSGQAPPGQPVGHYALDGGSYEWVTNVTRSADGDAGGYDTLSGLAVAKNVLTVAAVEDVVGGYLSTSDVQVSSFSSYGPCDDGRIKPDVAANGVALLSASSDGTYAIMSGTSMSSPSAAGALGLLLEQLTNVVAAADTVLGSTLKALVLHTADEAGPAPGPDYVTGWGLMNAARAAQLLTAHAQSSNALTHVKEIYVHSGDFVQIPVTATGTEPLKVTACWTDPPGSVPAAAVDTNIAALVNDLDLRVYSTTNTYYPWRLDPASPSAAAVADGDNARDNVEQVLVEAPVTGGSYTVQITHKGQLVDEDGLPSWQALSLIISGVAVEPAPELRISAAVLADPDHFAFAWASVVGAVYRIRTSVDLDAWTDATGDISATKTLTAVLIDIGTGGDRRFWRIVRIR